MEINFQDLVKIMAHKSSKKDGSGQLNYNDFSTWLGSSIHITEGFYFRHDSKRNPFYDKFLASQGTEKGIMKQKAAEQLMGEGDVLARLIEKIRQQWKTVRGAFRDFNEDNDPYIQKHELQFFLNHWGFPLTQDQADQVFDYFDADKDGLISYRDFIDSIGYEIHPEEGLYFRQDVHHNIKQSVCAYKGCWQATQGRKAYCVAHLKLCLSKMEKLFQNIYDKIKKNYPNNGWGKFILELKRSTSLEDCRLIKIEALERVLATFRLKLLDKQRYTI